MDTICTEVQRCGWQSEIGWWTNHPGIMSGWLEWTGSWWGLFLIKPSPGRERKTEKCRKLCLWSLLLSLCLHMNVLAQAACLAIYTDQHLALVAWFVVCISSHLNNKCLCYTSLCFHGHPQSTSLWLVQSFYYHNPQPLFNHCLPPCQSWFKKGAWQGNCLYSLAHVHTNTSHSHYTLKHTVTHYLIKHRHMRL